MIDFVFSRKSILTDFCQSSTFSWWILCSPVILEFRVNTFLPRAQHRFLKYLRSRIWLDGLKNVVHKAVLGSITTGFLPQDFTGFGIIRWSCEKKEVPFPSKSRPFKLCYIDPTQIDPVKISTSRSCPNKPREVLSNPVISQSRAVPTCRHNIFIYLYIYQVHDNTYYPKSHPKLSRAVGRERDSCT